MYRIKTEIPDLREHFGDLPRKSQAPFRNELRTVVKPALEREIPKTLGVEPGQVRRPFDFNTDRSRTDKSRRAFFATKGFGRGLGAARSHQLSTSWFVRIGYQIRDTIISFVNPKDYAKRVYPGKDQVKGHRNTGWGRDFERAKRYLQGRARVLVAEAWRRSINIALRKR